MQHELKHLSPPGGPLSPTPADSPTPTEPLFSQTMPSLHSEATGPVRSRSALQNRLRLKPTASRSTGALKQPPKGYHQALANNDTSLVNPNEIKFYWKAQCERSQRAFLFIAHDNPQLGKTLSTMLSAQTVSSYATPNVPSSSSSASSSASSKVQAMLESGDNDGSSRFLLGDIVYSGEYEYVEGAQLVDMRGSFCIVLTGLYSAVCNVKSLPKTPKGEIVEVTIPFGPLGFRDTAPFLKPCAARVDVILDPHQSPQNNFPYFEGHRKMAPQFRSKGVGYIRLGDDMSRFGVAFISLDAGWTYLDEGQTNITGAHSLAHTLPSHIQALPHAHTPPVPVRLRSESESSVSSSKERVGLTLSMRRLVQSSRSNSLNSVEVHDSSETDWAGGTPSSIDTHSTTQTHGLLIHTADSTSTMASSIPTPHIHTPHIYSDVSTPVLHPNAHPMSGLSPRFSPRGKGVVAGAGRDKAMGVIGVCAEKLLAHPAPTWQERVSILSTLCEEVKALAPPYPQPHPVAAVLPLLPTLLGSPNPNVLMAALRCVESIGTMVRGIVEETASKELFALPQWRAVWVACLPLLRSNHRGVCEAAAQAFHALYRAGALAMAVLLEEVAAGLSGAGKAVAGGGLGKLLSLVTSLLLVERDSVVRKGLAGEVDEGCVWAVVKMCSPIFSHKEEGVRQGALALAAAALSLEVCQKMLLQQPSPPPALLIQHIRELCHPATPLSLPALCASLCDGYLGQGSAARIRDLAAANPKDYEKLTLAWYAALCAVGEMRLEVDSAEERNSASTPTPSSSSTATPSASVSALKKRIASRSKLRSASSAASVMEGEDSRSLEKTMSRSDLEVVEVVTSIDQLLEDGATGLCSPTVPSPPAPLSAALEGVWYETKLMLQKVPADDAGWEEIWKMVGGGASFFSVFVATSQQRSLSLGALLRQVLPFNEQTSSNDQASSAKQHRDMLRDDEVLSQLADQAIRIRQLLRVKMADEADFKQAQVALATLHQHMYKILQAAGERQLSFGEMVKLLDKA
eukprot:gene27967-33772_t